MTETTFIVRITVAHPLSLPDALHEVADQVHELHNRVLDMGGSPGAVAAGGNFAEGGSFTLNTED